MIICGEKTVDGDTGQVGPEIAEHLGIPHVAYVSEIKKVGGKMIVACEMEGNRYLIESGFPLLITVTKDINVPRLPSLSNKLKARKAKIEIWTATDLTPNPLSAEDTESISLVRVPLAQIPDLITSGDICDAKSIAGLLAFLEYQKAH